MKRKALSTLLVGSTTCAESCKKDDPEPDPQVYGTPDEPLTDIDGNTYKTVKIGNKVWIAENFKAVKTSEGLNVQGVYEESNSNTTAYGLLYTWPAAVQAAPTGWLANKR